jgi:hypothetical protein
MSRIRELLKVLWSVVRELSDESAYQRHLARSGAAHSAAEWRKFSECRFNAKYRRARCC